MNGKEDYIFGLLHKAFIDYEMFILVLSQRRDLGEGAAFHAQQAAEKWLKALLVFNEHKPRVPMIYLCFASCWLQPTLN